MKLAIRLFKYLAVVKWHFVIGISLMLTTTFMMQMSPLIMQQIIDHVLTPVSQGQPFNRVELLKLIVIFFGVVLITLITGYAAIRILAHCANRIGETLRNEAYKKLQSLPISYFDDKPAGKIGTRIVNDTETLRTQFFNNVIVQMSYSAFVVVFIYIIMFTLNIWLGLILLLLLPFMYFWQKFYAKATKKSLDTFYESQSLINTYVNETMNGSEILQLFHQEQRMIDEFDRIAHDMYQAERKLVGIETAYSWSLMELFKRIILFSVVFIVGNQFLDGQSAISTGLLFSSVNYTDRLFNSVGMLVRQLPSVQRSMATGRRVMELLDAESESVLEQPFKLKEGKVSFENVSFSYNGSHQVLKNINLSVNKGEVVALVGHTGSGKSSIINLLFRFYDPQEGRILIDEQDISQFNRESLRHQMGIVLQDPYLFTGTIFSNVSMDDRRITKEIAQQSMHAVGAQMLLDKLENGIDEPVVEKGNAFSSGERQLISFARTLAADPKILILDEATSHIDTETEEMIQNAMKVVQKGRTTFIIAHRLSTIVHADHILVLHEGEIVERGTHDSLLQLNGKYAEMYRMQSKITE